MKFPIIFILLFCIFSCQNDTEKYDIAVTNITIIDVENSELLANKTIYIKNGRIKKIDSEKIIEREIVDTIINGKNKFISSGFWDMHVHSCWKDGLDKTIFPTFLQFGITGIRDMGGSLDILNTFKDRAKNQPYSYPFLYGSGPILDGENPIHPAFSISINTKNFRSVLDSLTNQNVDFFKTYSLLKNDVLDSIAKYSKEKTINFSGHISEYITPENASKLGQKSFEHLNKLEELKTNPIRLKKFIEIVKENGNWICPTLIIYQRKYEFVKGKYLHHLLYESLDSDLKTEWEQSKNLTAPKDEAAIENAKNRLDNQKQLVKIFHDNKIPILLGTDFAGMPFVYQGYSLHEEMKLLENIGISQFEIFKIATLNPTIYLGISEEYGTVEINKMADLIIFNKNPIEKIENTLSISNVIKSGKIVK